LDVLVSFNSFKYVLEAENAFGVIWLQGVLSAIDGLSSAIDGFLSAIDGTLSAIDGYDKSYPQANRWRDSAVLLVIFVVGDRRDFVVRGRGGLSVIDGYDKKATTKTSASDESSCNIS
jgi:hypothetical protein